MEDKLLKETILGLSFLIFKDTLIQDSGGIIFISPANWWFVKLFLEFE